MRITPQTVFQLIHEGPYAYTAKYSLLCFCCASVLYLLWLYLNARIQFHYFSDEYKEQQVIRGYSSLI
jgi:hypothetical protein